MKTWISAAADVVAVVVFAAVGRASHAESGALLGLAQVAWPFLVGAAAGAVITRYWRAPAAVVPTGLGVWLGSLVGGMALRAVTGAGVQVSFVIVAAIALAILLLGWRAAHSLVARRRRTAIPA